MGETAKPATHLLGNSPGKKMMMQTKTTQELYVFDSTSSANEDEHENKLTVV